MTAVSVVRSSAARTLARIMRSSSIFSVVRIETDYQIDSEFVGTGYAGMS